MKQKIRAESKPRGWIYGAKWGGRPCEARVVRVLVGASPPEWWCADEVGKERLAIEVKFEDQTVYVDNENGWALKTFIRELAPLPGTRFFPVFKVLEDETIPLFYKTKPV